MLELERRVDFSFDHVLCAVNPIRPSALSQEHVGDGLLQFPQNLKE